MRPSPIPGSRQKAIRPFVGSFGVALALGVAMLLLGAVAPSGASQQIANVQYDLLYRNLRDEPPIDERIRYFDISDSTIEEYGGVFPIARSKHAALLAGLGKAGARVTVWDFIFPVETPDDAALIASLGVMPAVLGIGAAVPDEIPRRKAHEILAQPKFQLLAFDTRRLPKMEYTAQSAPRILAASAGGGHVGSTVDSDGIIRRVAPVIEVDGKAVPSLGLVAALRTLGVVEDTAVDVRREGRTLVLTSPPLPSPLVIPLDEHGYMLLNFRSDWLSDSSHALDRRPYESQLGSMEDPDGFEMMAPEWKGKTIFVGYSGSAAADFVAVPWGRSEPGVIVSIATANTILTGTYLRTAPSWLWKLLTLLAPLAVSLAWTRFRPSIAALVSAGVLALLPLVSIAAFAAADTFLPVAGALAAALFTGTTLAILSLSREQARAVRIAGVLSRFVSPALLRELEDSAARDRLPPAKRAECTVLFIDVAGFTPFTEGQEPEVLSAFLDSFYELAMEELEKQGGTLEKFMGDGLLAYFGAPEPQPDKELRAVRAAMAIRDRFARFDGQRVARGGLPLAIRCGITTDWVAVGYFGGGNRGTYGVIGRSVNLASRVQGHAEPGGILVDRPTAARLGGQIVFRPLPPIELKGIAKPVEIFAVAGPEAVGAVVSNGGDRSVT